MKTKPFVAGTLMAMLLTACQTTSVEQLQPTASLDTINKAKEVVSSHEHFNVTDNGVIHFSQNVPVGSRWSTAHIVEAGYRVSCESLRWFVDRGMVVRVQFKGKGGRTEDYDQSRCETDVPTNLYES